MVDTTTIVPFRQEFSEVFALLNQEWIEQFFTMEESDLKMLRDPHASILSSGGQIFFRTRRYDSRRYRRRGAAVGCCLRTGEDGSPSLSPGTRPR